MIPVEEKRALTIATWCAWTLGPGLVVGFLAVAFLSGRLWPAADPASAAFTAAIFAAPVLILGHLASSIFAGVAVMISRGRELPIECWLVVVYLLAVCATLGLDGRFLYVALASAAACLLVGGLRLVRRKSRPTVARSSV